MVCNVFGLVSLDTEENNYIETRVRSYLEFAYLIRK